MIVHHKHGGIDACHIAIHQLALFLLDREEAIWLGTVFAEVGTEQPFELFEQANGLWLEFRIPCLR